MSVGERASRFFERHRGGFAAAGALTLLVGVGEAVRRRNQRSHAGAQLYTENDSPKRTSRYLACPGLVVELKEGHKIEDVRPYLAIVDPAGMHILGPNKPDGAGGASKAIYDLLGLTTRTGGENTLPQEVVNEFTKTMRKESRHPNADAGEGRAIRHYYNKPPYNAAVHVIHVVGPHFHTLGDEKLKNRVVTWEEAVVRLGRAYARVFEEAEGLDADVTTVRLPVISGSIFAGKYKDFDCLPELTARAIYHAAQAVVTTVQGGLKKTYWLCVGQSQMPRFRDALCLASSVKMYARVDQAYPHNYARPAIKLPVTEVKHERGAVGYARALYRTLNKGGAINEKIGLMIAGNNGRPGGSVGHGLRSIPIVNQGMVDSGVRFELTTQEESVVSDWLDAVAGSEHEARSRVFRSTICGLWGQKARGSPETIQGVNYKTSTDAADYDRAWVVRDASLEHDGECTATLVFVAGPNANGSAGNQGGSMRETFSQKAHDEYPFFKKCVSVSVRAGLLAMREEKVTHALVAYVSGGLYAGNHKARIRGEFKELVEQLVFDMEHTFTRVTVVDVQGLFS